MVFFRVALVADAARVVRRPLEIRFANADDEAVDLREALEHLPDTGAQESLRVGIGDVVEVGGMKFFHEPLGEDDHVGVAIDAEPGLLRGGVELVKLGRFSVEPCALR